MSQPQNPQAILSTPSSSAPQPPAYSTEERVLLLRLAHQSIEAALDNGTLDLRSPSTRLEEERGAFTTLYVDGQLHGCVGYVFAVAPLYRTIAETARAAAFDDPRFPALSKQDLATLKVNISVLSPLFSIKPEEVEIGRHGLLISFGSRKGLLLPQVPVEHGWDRITFLQQTCQKAGLPPDAWHEGANLQAFTAEVFGEDE